MLCVVVSYPDFYVVDRAQSVQSSLGHLSERSLEKNPFSKVFFLHVR